MRRSLADCNNKTPPALVICGATATGKSEFAVAVARRLNAEIVCADSMQIYRGLDVGTAKPTPEQRRAVPHHLVDFLDPSQSYSAAEFARDAREAIRSIRSRGKTPIICGGTGLYISTLLDGIEFTDSPADPTVRAALRERFEREGGAGLYEQLCRCDPTAAAAIHPNNVKRVMRALEFFLCEGYQISEQNERSRHAANPLDADVYCLEYTDRAELYRRIDARVEQMVKHGLVDEAQDVWRSRAEYGGVLQSIGYKELFAYFEGDSSLDECINELKTATRHYAKRQMSWINSKITAKKLPDGTVDSEEFVKSLKV